MPTKPPELLPAAGKAPTSSRSRARTPRMCPSSSTAQLTVIVSSRACWPARRFSRRSSIHLTGRARRLPATTTATSSGSMNIFCPKPPPTSCIITRTRFSGRPSGARQEPAHAVGPLGRGVHEQVLAVGVPDRHDPPALHGDAEVAVLRERLRDDLGRRRHHLLELVVLDVGHAVGDVVGPFGVDRAGARREGGVVTDDGGDRVDLDLDEVAGVLGDVARLGHDEHDRLAGEADVAVGEHAEGPALVAALEVDPGLGDVAVELGAGEHGDHPGQLAGGADVERRDRAAGHVAADEGHVQESGHGDVVDVLAVAGQQAGVLPPLHSLADEAVAGGGVHWSTVSLVRASERQRASGQQRPAWPGNAITFTIRSSRSPPRGRP